MVSILERRRDVPTTADRSRTHGLRHAVGQWLRQPERRPLALLVLATAVAATVVYWMVHRSLVDDAYITLAYARTLADHGDWGMLPGHESNSATSALNVLLIGGLSVIVGDPVLALGVLYVLSCVGLALGLRALGRDLGLGYRVAAIGTPLLIASPLLVSTVGLETMLVVAAMAHLAAAAVRGDAVRFGLVAGVLLWLRLDTVVIIGILAVATPALWRRLHLAAGLATAVVLPWLVASWFFLGSAIPDTLVIKQAKPWGDFATDLVDRYSDPYTWAIGGVLVIGGLGLLATLTWVGWRRRLATGSGIVPALAVAGGGYFLLMWSLQVPPFFWYYAPTLAVLIMCAAIGAAALGRLVLVGAGGAALALTLMPWWHGANTQTPLREMPIHGNWALPAQYAEIGREMGAIVGDAPVRSAGEVGGLAYFCECTIVDRFSIRAEITDQIRAAKQDSWLYRLNYRHLDLADLDPVRPHYRLRWERGPDPTGRGWNTTGIQGGFHQHGHYELVRVGPGRDGSLR